jgi:hypothetical protein
MDNTKRTNVRRENSKIKKMVISKANIYGYTSL